MILILSDTRHQWCVGVVRSAMIDQCGLYMLYIFAYSSDYATFSSFHQVHFGISHKYAQSRRTNKRGVMLEVTK